jgi:hypothetical protein
MISGQSTVAWPHAFRKNIKELEAHGAGCSLLGGHEALRERKGPPTSDLLPTARSQLLIPRVSENK